MPAAPIPWEPSNCPIEIQEELDRRRRNISLDFVKAEGSWKGGDWQKYKGPMSAWIRVCSNGRGRLNNDVFNRQRFVFFGGKDYQSVFGLKKTSTSPNSQIIGYMPDKNSTPHIIENERTSEYPIHIPTPEISRVEMTIQKEVLRRAVIEWTCFSWKQLEYMTPYFLVPGITMMVEMGWNHFNPESLVDITDEQLMKNLWENPYPLYEKNIINSKGNYDVIYGLITNFNWSVEGNNRYICTTEITSKNRLYAGIAIDSEMIDGQSKEVETLGNLSDFLKNSNTIMNFRQLARYGPDNFLDSVESDVSSLSQLTKGDKLKILFAALLGPQFGATTGAAIATNRQLLKSRYSVSQTFQLFFESLKLDIDASNISDKDKKLRTSYLYGVFDGRSQNIRDVNKKTRTPNEGDFDSQESDSNVWFNMGLISLIINYFSARWSVSENNPLLELDIDDVIIGAHRNLISADGNVLLIPNAGAPKYFWGDQASQTEINAKNTEWNGQAILGEKIKDPKKLSVEDKLIRKLFYFGNRIARDNHDVIINRYTYRLNMEGRSAVALAEKSTRSFPALGDKDDKKIHGYLRDLYFNVNKFIQLVESSETFYDLINKILNAINVAGANFWELRPVDNQKGKIGVVDLNYVGRDGKGSNLEANDRVLSFDMHDANNIVKSFKFRPQLSDAQTTRALYGQVSNPATQFYSKEEKSDIEWSFKDALMQNTVEDTGKTVLSKRRKSLSEWKSMLYKIQRINDSTDSYQMKLQWGDSIDNPMIEERLFRKQFHQHIYVKLALPSGVGRSVLRKMLDDLNYNENQKYCAIQPNINAEITLQGIGGLRTFQCFLIKNLPRPYSEDRILFQIVNVMDHIESGNWETTIVAGIRPLRKFIADKLGI